MSLDGMMLHCVMSELRNVIIGARVEKIHQPTREELVFSLRTREGPLRLLLSARADSPRVHITQRIPENPQNPPMLCMLLRKRLTGARITEIRQNGLDRVLLISFDAINELYDHTTITIAAELMGRYSNIIVIDTDGTIIDAVKRVDETVSSVRLVLPREEYHLPEGRGRLSLLEASPADVFDRMPLRPNLRFSKALGDVLEGVSPILCRELAYRSCGDDIFTDEIDDSVKARLENALGELKLRLCEYGTDTSPCGGMIIDDQTGKPKDYSFFDIQQYGSALNIRRFDELGELLDDFYYERVRIDRIRSRCSDLIKLVTNAITRVSGKLSNQRAELEKSRDCDELRIYGDLITACQHSLTKGVCSYELENFYDENRPVRIKADPALSPSQNAQKYYKEYRKGVTAHKLLGGLIESGEHELSYLETVLDELSRADTDSEVSDIRSELIESGYIKAKKTQKKPLRTLPPRELKSPDGLTVLVGRSNIQNDFLTFKRARKSDLWFHVKGVPGSHVILLTDGLEASREAIDFAAEQAAYYSKARENPTAEVDYTLVKNVRKQSGGHPGMVIYDSQKTVRTTKTYDKKGVSE